MKYGPSTYVPTSRSWNAASFLRKPPKKRLSRYLNQKLPKHFLSRKPSTKPYLDCLILREIQCAYVVVREAARRCAAENRLHTRSETNESISSQKLLGRSGPASGQ